ncbi:hypothetical protein M408DRAFT_28719, partial [Serendipita vermifera MAFF 305830]
MVVTDQATSTTQVTHAQGSSPALVISHDGDGFTNPDVSEEFIYLGCDAFVDDADDEQYHSTPEEDAHTGGTASDPEVATKGRQQNRWSGERKKKVRWELSEGERMDLPVKSSGIPPVPRRRRSKSLTGDELYNFRTPSKRSSVNSLVKTPDQTRERQPAPPVILPHLPILEGGWQTTPFSFESGIPIIIQRPVSDESQPLSGPLDTIGPHLTSVLTASPRSIRTLSGSEEEHDVSRLSPHHESGPAFLTPNPPTTEDNIPTAPNSPAFPPLPTPAPSASTIPKFTAPPNFVQSPKPAVIRTVSRDRSSLDMTSRSGIPFDNNTNMYKSPSHRLSRQSSLSQRSSLNRRSLQAGPSNSISSSAFTKPSPPNVTFSTSSPRSPLIHSLSPRTPQSTTLSPAPLASIATVEDNNSSHNHEQLIVPRPESPPWKTVGSSVGITSPRMKGGGGGNTTNTPSSASWRTEVINSSAILIKSPPVTPFTSVHLRIDELPNETDSEHESVHHSSTTSTLAPIPPVPAIPGALGPSTEPLIAPITPDSSINH